LSEAYATLEVKSFKERVQSPKMNIEDKSIDFQGGYGVTVSMTAPLKPPQASENASSLINWK